MSALPPHKTKFKNPIVESGADPYVATDNQYFYYCYVVESDKTEIYINKSEGLEDIGKSKPVTAWSHTDDKPYSRNIWAPELHHLNSKWYIYFAADNSPTNVGPVFPNHRLYVLEADRPLGPYRMLGKIADKTDLWAIDGTILEHPNGKRYFVWSGWADEKGEDQQLYIARMINPWTLEGERVMISRPEYDWEVSKARSQGVNEGPQILQQGDRTHIIYSASWSGSDDYCLGQLDLVGPDPLDPKGWVKREKPIFEKSHALTGTGHACFLLSSDGQYGWMVFHAARHPGAGWDRQVRMAAFTWDDSGKLKFLRVDTDPFASIYRKLADIINFQLPKNN